MSLLFQALLASLSQVLVIEVTLLKARLVLRCVTICRWSWYLTGHSAHRPIPSGYSFSMTMTMTC